MRTSGPSTTHNRHARAFFKIVEYCVSISDFVIEILDARDIELSRNRDVENIIQQYEKKLIYVINKVDMVDRAKIEEIKKAKLGEVLFVSVTKNAGIKKLRERILIESKRLKQDRKTHITFVGYPNVGKSSLINLLVRRNAAPVSNQAGWTKSERMIRFTKDILFYDVPGLVEKEESMALGEENLKNQAKIGVQTPERARDPEFIIADLIKHNPGKFEKFYELDVDGDSERLLDELGKKWNFLKKKGQADVDRTARKILKDWMDGKIK